jgi:hypothetical protein
MEITTRTTVHGDEDPHGRFAHMEMEIAMRYDKGAIPYHLYKLPVKFMPLCILL